jgi:hypothetical protein
LKERKQDDMRRSPQTEGQLACLLAVILVLGLLLFTTLTPLAIAGTAKGDLELEGEFLAVAMMQGGEDGRVTDDDGRIGNSPDGADRPAEDDSLIRDAAPQQTPGERNGEQGGGPMENGNASDGNSLGVLPWIIGSLVVLAVVLVVLALLPKKNRSR